MVEEQQLTSATGYNTTPREALDAGWSPLQTAFFVVLVVLCGILVWNAYHPEDVYFADLKYDIVTADQMPPQKDQSQLGHTLQIKDVSYPRGISVHANSELHLRFPPEGYSCFVAEIGIDANAPEETGSVIFSVISEGTVLYESPLIKKGMAPIQVCVPLQTLRPAGTITLQVTDAGDGIAGDYADWALARFVYSL